ncbi:MAG: hypothetical protein JW864_00190 [Spirochaetes bacterium]|nr:hypothetical protein [Spirochaetota bacterium]
MKKIIFFIILPVIFILFCSSPEKKEEEKITVIPENAGPGFEKYLVNTEQYTTKGEVYHRKYLKSLLGIARVVTEDKGISVYEKSIGFYYDKREDRKDKLYLGIDISSQIDSTLYYSTYSGIALAQFRKYLKDIIYIFHTEKNIFSEEEIIGYVITIRWERDSVMEMVSIWIKEDDADAFAQNKITFDELIQRNFITNTDGKIIKLLL